MSAMSATVTVNARSDLHLKMEAEIAKLIAETSRINKESRAFPWLAVGIAVVANAGLAGPMGGAVAFLVAFHRRRAASLLFHDRREDHGHADRS